MFEFKMPSMGADMESAILIAWNVKPGDTIKKGDIICEIETAKGDIDVEIWEAGTVTELLIEPGTRVPVGEPIARLDSGGGDVPREPKPVEPPPEVTSAVVRLDPLPPDTFDIQDEAGLSTLVTTAFMQRRKTLRNSLKKLAERADFEATDIDAGLRPEQVSIADYVRLSNYLRQKSG